MLELPASFTATRASAHALAEYVLAPARVAIDGKIRLRPLSRGFCMPPVGPHHRSISVIDDVVVVAGATGEAEATALTIRQVAAFVDVEPGAQTVFTPTEPADFDAPLTLDPASMAAIGTWFELADHALVAFATSVGDEVHPVLWPEHFDLGIAIGAANFGASLGDGTVAEPYLYVGPHDLAAVAPDDFWNVGFGAAVTHRDVASIGDAIAFFATGWNLLRP